MEVFIIIIFVVLLGFGIYFGIKATQKRVSDLRILAQNNKLQFSSGQSAVSYPFLVFQRGHSRYAYNIMEGSYQDHPLTAFDYHYAVTTQTKNGPRTTHYHFSAALFNVDFLLTSLFIRPENFFDKIGEFIGLDDIDFESAEFSKKFYVKSSDKKFAYDVIHQKMMEYLLVRGKYNIEFSGYRILIYQNHLWEPGDFQKVFDFGAEFIKLFPEYLVKQLKERPA